MISLKKKSIYNFLIVLIFSLQLLNAEEQALSYDFFKLEKEEITDQLVQIRGFLYKTEDSLLILAAEPNLKSCCVGSSSKRHRQLLVSGNVDPAINQSHAVTLKGDLHIDSTSNFPNRLENAMIVKEEDQSLLLLILIGSTLVLASLGFFAWKQRK